MSSWEGAPEPHDRRDRGGDDPGDVPAPPDGGPSVTAPGPVVPAPPASGALGLVPSDEPGVDPFPSTGSLVWAPDPTEQLPVLPAGPPPGAPTSPAWPDPIGEPLPATGHVPAPPPAVPGPPGPPVRPDQVIPPRSHPYTGQHLRAPGSARRPRGAAPGGPPGPPRSDRRVLGALGALGALVIVAVVVLAVTSDRDGSDAPEPSAAASPPPVTGDATDPAGPIVGPTGVIGSWSGSAWVPRPDGEQPGAGFDYTILGLGDAFDTARGEATAEDCPAQRATSETDVVVDLPAGGDGPPPIAVAGIAEPRPRAVDQWSTDTPLYQQAAVDVAAGLGATTPPTLTQVLHTDLDGNGTDEVIVAAEHISDRAGLSPTPGDWSVVFLRRVAGNGAATDVLAASVVGGGGGGPAGDRLDRIQVATLADLNRDGTMEIALAGRSADGEWTSIHALGEDGVPSEVLRAGCEG